MNLRARGGCGGALAPPVGRGRSRRGLAPPRREPRRQIPFGAPAAIDRRGSRRPTVGGSSPLPPWCTRPQPRQRHARSLLVRVARPVGERPRRSWTRSSPTRPAADSADSACSVRLNAQEVAGMLADPRGSRMPRRVDLRLDWQKSGGESLVRTGRTSAVGCCLATRLPKPPAEAGAEATPLIAIGQQRLWIGERSRAFCAATVLHASVSAPGDSEQGRPLRAGNSWANPRPL